MSIFSNNLQTEHVKLFNSEYPQGIVVDKVYYNGVLVHVDSLPAGLVVTHLGSNNYSVKWDGSTELSSDLTIPAEVPGGGVITELDSYGFRNATSIVKISLPRTLTTIGNKAFEGCTNLQTLSIPESVTTVGSNGLGLCQNLTCLSVPVSVAGVICKFIAGSKLSHIQLFGEGALPRELLMNNNTLNSVEICNAITSIAESAFSGCSNLEKVSIGTGVTVIDSFAFHGCINLRDVTFSTREDSQLSVIKTSAFAGCSSLTTIVLPQQLTTLQNRVFASSAFKAAPDLSWIVMPSTLTSVGSEIFGQDLSKLTIYYEGSKAKWDTFRTTCVDTTTSSSYGYANSEWCGDNAKSKVYFTTHAAYPDVYDTCWSFNNQGVPSFNCSGWSANVVTEPTCGVLGKTVHTCSCGKTYTEWTDSPPHSWDNDVCTQCNQQRYKLTVGTQYIARSLTDIVGFTGSVLFLGNSTVSIDIRKFKVPENTNFTITISSPVITQDAGTRALELPITIDGVTTHVFVSNIETAILPKSTTVYIYGVSSVQ